MATLSTAARLQHATAQQQQRYQQYRADAIAALGQHGSRVLAGAQLTAVGQAYEGVEKATFGTYLRMLKRYWVPFCLWKAGSSGQPDFTVSGQRAADCADSTLELLLADATCDLNVESQVHQLINALDKLAVMQGQGAAQVWKHSRGVYQRASKEQAKRASAKVPGAGVLSVVEYDKLLESVGGGCSYEGTVMRAFLTFGVSLLLRGGHAAAVSLEGLGAIPLSGTQDQACMAFAVSLPPFKNVMAPRLVYVLRHVDALKCSVGNLAVLVWTLLSSKSGGTGQNLLGFDLLQRIEAAIDTDEPASALQLPLFGLSSGDADQKAESVAAALTNRLRERVKAAFEAAGIEPALKEGVLKLMRPTGTALASGSDVQLEMVQMLAGWSANASSVMLMHYWDKSPDTAKAAIDAIAGKEAGSQRDVPRAYVAPPPEWLEQLGVPAVQAVKAKALAALQGCGSKGAKAKGMRLVVSALGCFEELAGVLLQDLPLRIDVTGAWLKSNAVPPIPGVATILRDPKWFAFADGMRKSRAAGEAGPSFDPAACEAPPAQHWPALAVERAAQQASSSKQPGAAQVTGLTSPDDKLPPVEQLRHVLGCASGFDRRGFSELPKGCKDYASQYLRVADRIVALQQEYGVEEEAVVACYGRFMDGVDVGHPITFAALKDLLQHKPAAAGGKGDDSKPVKSTGGKVSYAAGHAALQRYEELLRSPVVTLAAVQQEQEQAQQEPQQEPEPPSTEAQQLMALQEQVARLQQELAAKEVELAAASGSGSKGAGKRKREQRQPQKQREPQKRKQQRLAADEVGEQPEGVFDGFVDHDGPMDTKHLLVGNSVVVYTTAQDANTLRLQPRTKARVWIIQLDRLPVRMNEAGDIKLVGRFHTNGARKAWEPLRLSEQLDWCVVGPEAVLEVFEGEVDVVTPEQAAGMM